MGPNHTLAAFAFGIIIVLGVIALIYVLSRQAVDGRHRWLALAGVCVVIYLCGVWLWPVWFTFAVVPVVGFFVLRPAKIDPASWDVGANPDKRTDAGRADEVRDELARGRCPDCGAKNPEGRERCHVCGRMLTVL